MQITTERTQFIQMLTKISATDVTQKDNTVRGLLCIKADADGNVALSANDGEISIATQASLGVEAPGEVVTPFKRVLDIVKSLESKTITLSVADNYHLSIKGGDTNFQHIPGTPAGLRTFFAAPAKSAVDAPAVIIESPSEFIGRLASLEKIVTEDIPGIHLHAEGEGIRLVTANRASMLIADLPSNAPAGSLPAGGIVMPECVVPALKTAFGAVSHLTMSVDGNRAMFCDGTTSLAVMLKGPYAQYRNVCNAVAAIPANKTFCVSKSVITNALRRLSLVGVTQKEVAEAKTTISFTADSMQFNARSASGEVSTSVPATNNCTDSVVFNSQRLLEMITPLDGDDVVGEVRGDEIMMVLKGDSGKIQAFVAPMRK